MKQLLLVGLFSVGCFAQAIEGGWCQNRCNSQVAAKFESSSPSDQVAEPILESRQDGRRTDDRCTAPILRSAMVQVAVPILEPRHDGRRMENHWTAPVLRSTVVPIVIVRSIADDGDDLAEALLQLWHDFPGVAWCLQYLAEIFMAVVLPILAMFAVYLAALRLASSLPRKTSVARQRAALPKYGTSQSVTIYTVSEFPEFEAQGGWADVNGQTPHLFTIRIQGQ